MHKLRGPATKARWGILVLTTLFPLGCGAEGGDSRVEAGPREGPGGPDLASVETWALSEAPILEIGVREGEDPYQLHRVRGSLRLEDGRIVVLNAGSHELRYYDQAGSFLKSVGREGEGPGEFRDPAGLRRTRDGGLRVWDRGLLRASVFDTAGTYQEVIQLLVSREELFPGDDWIMGSNWIESPVPPEARGPIREAVEGLPPPDSSGALRTLMVTPQGRIWVPGDRPPAETPTDWLVFDLQGHALARVTTPPRFQPQEIREDYLIGLFRDEVDVNYVHLYALEKPPGSPAGPGLDPTQSAGADSPRAVYVAADPEVLAGMKSLLKIMASLEEIYYSNHYTYTSDLDELFSGSPSPRPTDLVMEVLFADSNGWALRVGDPGSDAQCIIGYGYFVPMGWQPGTIRCF